MITLTSRISRSISPLISKLLIVAGVRIVPEVSGKTWSLWQSASAEGNRRLCVNWSSKVESRGVRGFEGGAPAWESNLPNKDMLDKSVFLLDVQMLSEDSLPVERHPQCHLCMRSNLVCLWRMVLVNSGGTEG
jgi:hypothetical protein